MVGAAARETGSLWAALGLPETALERLALSGREPTLRSSFAVGTAAQASLAFAALAASEIGRVRNGLVQSVAVDMREAALECCGWFTLDGRTPAMWDPVAGLYPCGPNGRDGWIR